MCGIAGVRSFEGAEAEPLALRMSRCLAHRGPDDDGTYSDGALALGFRRLSIIDLTAAGAQPMISASGRYVIIFNGEVYNHARLRDELPAQRWRGHSDTEVMLACIEAWGLERAVERFIGMFAFALWDKRERTLTLVRDRLGVKPLYYSHTPRSFQFASELKALAVERDVDPDAVALYLKYGYVPAPFSIYRHVRKLPPGCMLTLHDDGRLDVRSYWSAARVAERVERFRGSEAEALEQLAALADDAVRLRMIADVPLGVFLSGGVDSSLVTALMQRADSAPVSTFTIGFEDRRFDEAPYAAAVARHLGTSHREEYVSVAETLAAIPRLAAIYDEPFGDSSAIPTYLVSRMARRDVTVALSGDGGDELFGGYHRYFLGARNSRRAARVPRALRRPLGRALRRVPRLRGVGDTLVADDPLQTFLDQLGVREYDAPEIPLTNRDTWPRMSDPVEVMMVLDAMHYLPDDILTKVDRASMSVSLEVREPLLDHRLVEFAWSLPLSMKIRDDRGKWILRQLLRRHVPDALIEREKQGFGLPLAEWLRGPLRDWSEALVRKSRFAEARTLWDRHLRGHDQAMMWRLLAFEAWDSRIPLP